MADIKARYAHASVIDSERGVFNVGGTSTGWWRVSGSRAGPYGGPPGRHSQRSRPCVGGVGMTGPSAWSEMPVRAVTPTIPGKLAAPPQHTLTINGTGSGGRCVDRRGG
ncbi:MAG: type II toxin-antitoxin system HigB family toxin [Deltaproteobacteria bacterium]|nr:type II toxin-antitoxin system HigB family toxin [Deltaproteobacteria bacterium]